MRTLGRIIFHWTTLIPFVIWPSIAAYTHPNMGLNVLVGMVLGYAWIIYRLAKVS